MGDADLIRSFRALQNSESRKEALGALLRELSPYEWRFTHHLLAQRSWCCDIVASLPLELVAHIFSHVDTAAPFRLQQVSTRWRTILRSLDVLKPNLNAWYDDTSHLEAFDYGQCRKRAEDAHRFRSGKYAKLSSVPVETLPLESILVEDTLVSRCPSYRSILVENLRTGESWKGQGSARELITYTAASEEIVAFTTSSSTCYVTNVAGEQKRKFKLHGSMFKTAPVCSGRTIICAGFSENYAEIYMWNFDTQKGSSFRIGRDQPLFASHNNECTNEVDLVILPDARSRTMTLLTTSKCNNPSCHAPASVPVTKKCIIYYSRFTFEGHHLGHGCFATGNLDFKTTKLNSRNVRPIDRQGGYLLEVLDCTPHNNEETLMLEFNERTCAFSYPQVPRRSLQGSPERFLGPTAWWKDTFYQAVPHQKSVGARDIINPDTKLTFLGDRNDPRSQPVTHKLGTKPSARVLTPQKLLLNDRYAVVCLREYPRSLVDVYKFEQDREPACSASDGTREMDEL